MAYHTSERDLMQIMKEKGFFAEWRWDKMVDEGLTTMEALAHYCCPGGDISQPLDGELSINMIKLIEGDWTVPRQKYDDDGKKMWKIKTP